MPRGLMGLPRFVTLGPLTQPSFNQNEPAFQDEEDVLKIAERIVRRTPGEIRQADFMGFFDEPTIFIDFFLPSDNFKTIDRNHFTSSLTARANNSRISEMSIRFPAIKISDIDQDKLQNFLEDVNPDPLFEVRIQVQELVDDEDQIPEYHPHIHFSKTKIGRFGPKLIDEAPEMNKMIRKWYSDVGEML